MDGGAAFAFQEDADEGKSYLKVVCARDEGLDAEQEIFLMDHSWTFKNKEEAKVCAIFSLAFRNVLYHITLLRLDTYASTFVLGRMYSSNFFTLTV